MQELPLSVLGSPKPRCWSAGKPGDCISPSGPTSTGIGAPTQDWSPSSAPISPRPNCGSLAELINGCDQTSSAQCGHRCSTSTFSHATSGRSVRYSIKKPQVGDPEI